MAGITQQAANLPVQQDVNINFNPAQYNNIQVQQVNDNNDQGKVFIIHTTVNSPEININDNGGQQAGGLSQVNLPKISHIKLGSGGGGYGKSRSYRHFSLVKTNKKFKHFFNYHNRKRKSSACCFSWS